MSYDNLSISCVRNPGPETIRCYNDPQDDTHINTCEICDEVKEEDMPNDMCEACESEQGRIRWEELRDHPGIEFADMLDGQKAEFSKRGNKWLIFYFADMQLSDIEVWRRRQFADIGCNSFRMKVSS